ncbi:acyl-CoA dehydrogenase family protein [Saccharopolyspora endophytica]|uniref:Acyl-CoA dehydrogenase family protein n=1 Tax=Saccharopolyspora endophytica TaxID=543886 RepID=A0ABS5DQM9_9PSEU|nr:acyl-CoA dehydrogenase family protein [Saccharopolyspora endophytica]MBQ0928601.1 acyl-CoA dehydrogenase family protein [Saccharopolyspora endophytica]
MPTGTGVLMFTSRSRHTDRAEHIDRDFLVSRHRALISEVAEFAQEHVRPRVAELEASGEVNEDLVRVLARRGWIGATIPTRYGGAGLDHRSRVVIIDQLARVSGAIAAAAQASDIPVAMFLHIASPAQKQEWLPMLASGQTLASIAVTEPRSGGHVLGMETTATRNGDAYALTGQKCYVGNSHVADVHAVVARTAERQLSVFVVDANADGLTLMPHQPASGMRGFSFGDLRFQAARIPSTARLGAQGDGLDAAYLASVVHGRLDIAAVAVGLHHELLAATVSYVQGHPRLRTHETVQQRLGQMQSNLLTARQAVYHAAWLLDSGGDCDAELFNAKHVGIDLGIHSARLAAEVFGARALRAAEPVERCIRDLQYLWAPAGTGDVQRFRLYQTALGITKSSWSLRSTT